MTRVKVLDLFAASLCIYPSLVMFILPLSVFTSEKLFLCLFSLCLFFCFAFFSLFLFALLSSFLALRSFSSDCSLAVSGNWRGRAGRRSHLTSSIPQDDLVVQITSSSTTTATSEKEQSRAIRTTHSHTPYICRAPYILCCGYWPSTFCGKWKNRS